MKQATCPSCGKRFTVWRQKAYCSERCRKRAQNQRLGYSGLGGMNQAVGTPGANSPNPDEKSEQNQHENSEFRRDEPCQWIAVNEVTRKLVDRAGRTRGWAFDDAGGRGWFGKVRDERGEWGFGPTTQARARLAVERCLDHAPVEAREGERIIRGSVFAGIGL